MLSPVATEIWEKARVVAFNLDLTIERSGFYLISMFLFFQNMDDGTTSNQPAGCVIPAHWKVLGLHQSFNFAFSFPCLKIPIFKNCWASAIVIILTRGIYFFPHLAQNMYVSG